MGPAARIQGHVSTPTAKFSAYVTRVGPRVDTWVTVACWVRGDVLGHVSANGDARGALERRKGWARVWCKRVGKDVHVLMSGILSFVLLVLVVFLQSNSLLEL